MKIGYPCINTAIGCSPNRTLRLASYTHERIIDLVGHNLRCLHKIVSYNYQHKLLFFRISSDTIPFASHALATFDWLTHFAHQLADLGECINRWGMRISMHPDQFVLINALDSGIIERSIAELMYHAQFLDALGLDTSAKIQIHVGGVYGDKPAALQRFIAHYHTLAPIIKRRLVIENDDRLFSLRDCLYIHEHTGIPIIFDVLHHELLNDGQTVHDALAQALATWGPADGIGMVDYSSQEPHARKGKHATTLEIDHVSQFIVSTQDLDFDMMLEIKDKQASALKALELVQALRL